MLIFNFTFPESYL